MSAEHAGDLYGEMFLAQLDGPAAKPSRIEIWKTLWPGLAICGIASIAAAWLSEHYGAPIILMGLLIGLALNFVTSEKRTHPGLDFASKACLRWGIVVLGTQVTLAQIVALGPVPFLALLMVMAAAMGAALLVARATGASTAIGILAGGATAICGASAALALFGVLGAKRISQAQFALTLVVISMASAIAMSFYPPLAGLMHLDDRQAGFLIGASIHDVAQAIGGGYAYSDIAGSYATIVKLSRVALLAPIVAVVSLMYTDEDAGERHWIRKLAMPWFITLFLAVVVLNSLVTIPAFVVHLNLTLSKTLLLLAVTATAMRSRLDLVMQMGWRAAMPVVAATLASLVVATAFSMMIL
ncbi:MULTISPECIES: YeiH family protein [Novosphingobium]|uniref:Putative membrane protein n=1 Tax=Novosphingobium resinovorum TaxID=158500 RepID=A0A031JYQ1_9SPHN|nr:MULTISPECIES: putative sulfate exporter family transporter [Novosphingobium]EZP81903.1 putative membrane protein [Novosphingobium resinovorum]WJM28375.1 putative sulfate exporter family transporter [Novosphingobium resinovorum]GLK43686.1 membrane protein [Novosphingobium resinovorum]